MVRCLEHSSALDVVDVWRGTIGKRQSLETKFFFVLPSSKLVNRAEFIA